MKSINFNAHHSPVGAFASFTLGFPGPKGGLGLELGGPANESIFIGLERNDGRGYDALPFFGSSADSARRYDVSSTEQLRQGKVRPFKDQDIQRHFSLGTDEWQAGDLTFTIFSPTKSVPDPTRASRPALRHALVPAVWAELTIDNRHGRRDRRAFFGYEASNPFYNVRRLDDVSHGKFSGVGQGPLTAIVSDSPGVYSGSGFTLDDCLEPDFPENLTFGLGPVGVLQAVVPKGQRCTFRFAICFYRDGNITSGLPTRYFYTNLFSSIEDVAAYALQNADQQIAAARQSDTLLAQTKLSPAQKFQLAHAVRSYYGSTEFLQLENGAPFWVVNEGEYRMMNTFDLTVDHLFFEMDRNPWVVRNQLDWFVQRYSYTDEVQLPGDPQRHPGGLSFTHDMGIGNCFSRPGFSSYEKFGLSGCFSHMTHEQLVNWVCCATTYVLGTRDTKWLQKNASVLQRCLTSLLHRDHPDPRQRDGVMSADSSRCLGGAEITTYDSLDPSLGQARNNLYLAVKTWAAYLGLIQLARLLKKPKLAATAEQQARRCAQTIRRNMRPEGFIPAIEGLVFPLIWGLRDQLEPGGDFLELREILGQHLQNILRPGTCLFPDGGWKLSSTNDNSWLSKIYLCQFVARELFGWSPHSKAGAKADSAHAAWLVDPANGYFAWSDQMINGRASGSKYYPRGVTAWLWLRPPSAE